VKLQAYRFGRSSVPDDMAEGAGGGDYPTVVSDLTVEPDAPALFAGGTDLSVTDLVPEDLAAPEYEPAEDFWVESDLEEPGAPWWQARETWLTATAVVAVVAVVAASLAVSGGSSQAKRLSYTFPVEAFPQSGLTVSRTWTLEGGNHPVLHGDLIFYPSRSERVQVEELLPKSLVMQASRVVFVPKPRVVSEDPVVVSYAVAPASGGVTSAAYDIPVPKSDLTMGALQGWVAEETRESGQRYLAQHSLASVHLTPASIVIKKGGAPYQLAMSGLQTDGQPAATVAFGSAKWSVANPKVAKVSDRGLVSGLAAGKTTVRAVVGKLTATASVTVSTAANVKATPPLKILTPGPLLGLGPSSIPTSLGVLSAGGGTVLAHHNKPVKAKTPRVSKHTAPPPVTPPVRPPVVVPPVVTPPVVCTAPAPLSVAAGAGPDDTSVTVSWVPPAVPSGCTFSAYLLSGSGPAQVLSGTSFTYSGLAAGSTVQFAVAIGYSASGGPVQSAAVASNSYTLPAAPPPPPVCDAATETAPSGLAANPTANPGEFTVSWLGAGATSPCAVTGETALLDGGAVSNGSLVTLASGSHTLTVTATFADATSQSASLPIDVP
jgi:Bacterial Ig-like domain (group 2)